jgi:hypothetical protein
LVESTDYKYVITPSGKGRQNKRFVFGFLKEPGVLHAAAVLSPPRLQRAAATLAEPCPLPLIPTIYAPSSVGIGTLTQALIILVDSGSLHTFLNSNIAGKLKITSIAIAPMSVKVANGASLPCKAEVKNFEW